MSWTQLWVKHETQPTTQIVAIIEPYLMMFGALPCAPDGKVISAGDGTVEIRVFNPSATPMVKRLIADHGLIVEREVENSETD